MRKISKSKLIPLTLRNASVPASPDEVKESIYKADDVRDQLLEDQHYKCAYCESRITKEYNDVEHYRPKSVYYWLGHDWNNLLYSCDLCNRTYKKSYFPLKNETNRVTAPGRIDVEEPLIINPALEEPAIHIRFNRYMLVGVTDEGKNTIDIFKLNDRAVLVYDRAQLYELYIREKNKLEKMQKLLEFPALTDELRDSIHEIILSSTKSINQYKSIDTPYSGMLINQ